MAGDAFTKRRFDWLDQILADHDLSPNAFKLAYLISGFINRESRTAWPSQATLAKALGLRIESDGRARGVAKIVHSLAKRGHLNVTISSGRGHANEYSIVLKTRNAGSGIKAANPERSFRVIDGKPGTAVTETRNGCSEKPGTAGPIISLNKEIIDEPLDGYFTEAEILTPFETFWSVYPKKVAKAAAKRAWEKAVKKTPASEIIAGAERYAASRKGQDTRYTKHPSGWLNDGMWTDEPDAPAPTRLDSVSRALANFVNRGANE